MKKNIEDFGSKVIWTIVILLVTVVLDIFLFSNLGQVVLDAHRQETFTQMFNGKWGEWLFLAIYHLFTVAMFLGIWEKFQLTEEENSTKWGPIWVVCLIICLLLIAAI